ncbi:hypothetical protein [Rhizobium sp. CECT 9324]|uniref:hypothetical protein n=1 Tax=Rhizobium sp. CECT 9324 TaxID=2845820 RepID=UPI001E3F5AA4|nr:hypothetical protein [Rhizobium sp. CECT 9324]CAH0338611.1 hypothetical protein RHI9324_00233 [Rhizobium sp. CECT 9324]
MKNDTFITRLTAVATLILIAIKIWIAVMGGEASDKLYTHRMGNHCLCKWCMSLLKARMMFPTHLTLGGGRRWG